MKNSILQTDLTSEKSLYFCVISEMEGRLIWHITDKEKTLKIDAEALETKYSTARSIIDAHIKKLIIL